MVALGRNSSERNDGNGAKGGNARILRDLLFFCSKTLFFVRFLVAAKGRTVMTTAKPTPCSARGSEAYFAARDAARRSFFATALSTPDMSSDTAATTTVCVAAQVAHFRPRQSRTRQVHSRKTTGYRLQASTKSAQGLRNPKARPLCAVAVRMRGRWFMLAKHSLRNPKQRASTMSRIPSSSEWFGNSRGLGASRGPFWGGVRFGISHFCQPTRLGNRDDRGSGQQEFFTAEIAGDAGRIHSRC